jgi:hypothetical protein
MRNPHEGRAEHVFMSCWIVTACVSDQWMPRSAISGTRVG